MDIDDDVADLPMMELDDLADDDLPDENEVDPDTKEYRLRMCLPTASTSTTQFQHSRNYIAARFRSHLPDVKAAEKVRLFRDDENHIADRRTQRLEMEKYLRRQRTFTGQKHKEANELAGFSKVPNRVRKRMTMEVTLPKKPGENLLLPKMVRYRGLSEGEQNSSYVFLVLNDDDTIDIHPLNKNSWFSFAPMGSLSNAQEASLGALGNDEEAATAEDKALERAEAKMTKMLKKKKLEALAMKLAEKEEDEQLFLDFGMHEDKDAKDAKDREFKRKTASDEGAEEEEDVKPSILGKKRSIHGYTDRGPRDDIDVKDEPSDDDGHMENEYAQDRDEDELPRPKLRLGPEGSPRSDSDGEEDERNLTSSGRQLKKLLEREREQEGPGSGTVSPQQSPVRSPNRPPTGGFKVKSEPSAINLKKRSPSPSNSEDAGASGPSSVEVSNKRVKTEHGLVEAKGMASVANPSPLRGSPSPSRVSPESLSRIMAYESFLPKTGEVLQKSHIKNIILQAEKDSVELTIKELVTLLHRCGRLAENKNHLLNLIKEVAKVREQANAEGVKEYRIFLKDEER